LREKRVDLNNQTSLSEDFYASNAIAGIVPLQQNYMFKLFLTYYGLNSLFGLSGGSYQKISWSPKYVVVYKMFYLLLFCSHYFITDIKEFFDFRYFHSLIYTFLG
jgi:hypothetical protein